ncbi:hypothetical protein [Paraburkholderia ginsengisoli]|jgi:hypothetical protein|uniref:Uncharacterized protein n=1 Tax=Paraburkholderia ginsengisoli TaxID=311231 RepID=A0A7T4TAU6_9BURK|nr:hypothetical protein [Paraburkholderia ginsengisoli]QQC65928.1 hypothetical protein I6I06_24355 [Paraburkholderia ginsengisoli]
MFLTFIAVVAIAAFIPYVAAPGIANGVKAISSPPAAVSPDPAVTPATGTDSAGRLVPQPRVSEGAG